MPSNLLDASSRQALLNWYDERKRDLPWRKTSDPYAIWVSEIMLQQTQVATVIDYWSRWMERFPTAERLAAADEQEVLSLWQGLGYYRRCKLLLKGAKWVCESGMPATAAEWLMAPGVGPYTAAAIASIAQDDPVALVDGNVERVYSRLTADPSTGTTLHRHAWSWAKSNIAEKRAGDWNQALMELGATICRPAKPICPECPLRLGCEAFLRDKTAEFPKTEPKPKAINLRHVVQIPIYERSYGLRQIPAGQWWEGMWEFVRFDADGSSGPFETSWSEYLGRVRHSVTNHRITLEVSVVRCVIQTPELRWVDERELSELPLPSPQRKALGLLQKRREQPALVEI